MSRAVVTVATDRYVRGGKRLNNRLADLGESHVYFENELPPGSPPHHKVPYAFKASALQLASEYYDTLLWADACIYPVLPLKELWERIERDGAWISANGWKNATWTAAGAYEELGITRAENEGIEHVVATSFGLSIKRPLGRALLREYCRLGLTTQAFVGPWRNGPLEVAPVGHVPRTAPCGPPDVKGHRHDQTALSVIAWRLGIELSSPPDVFAYGQVGNAGIDPRTVLLADGGY